MTTLARYDIMWNMSRARELILNYSRQYLDKIAKI